jgi:hypothetical protein
MKTCLIEQPALRSPLSPQPASLQEPQKYTPVADLPIRSAFEPSKGSADGEIRETRLFALSI